MRLKPHNLQNQEPGETGGTDEIASQPTVNVPEVIAPEPQADVENPVDTPTKIDALLNEIGKTPEDKAPPAPIAPVTPPDPKAIDLTPPEGVDGRQLNRWNVLAERAKLVPELESRATEAESQINSVREMVQQSGLQPNEFQGMLEMGRLFKSDKPQDLHVALQQIDELRADLATRLGVDSPGIDVLAKHPDLHADVENLIISRERALEIAKLRGTAANYTATTTAQREAQQFQAFAQQSAHQMDAALAQRAGTPGHEQKIAHVKAYLADPSRLNQFVTTYQPNQWQAAVMMMYDSYQPPAPAVNLSAPQPLRPGPMAAGSRQPSGKPISSHAAVEGAFDSIFSR